LQKQIEYTDCSGCGFIYQAHSLLFHRPQIVSNVRDPHFGVWPVDVLSQTMSSQASVSSLFSLRSGRKILPTLVQSEGKIKITIAIEKWSTQGAENRNVLQDAMPILPSS